ncbi:conserved hypothetical protein [Ricinus communis]|uniref:Gnk2-homologous domain-containing protein n=1 Tax=Ricinus communis TaxID=3988 RepID=B9T488_RICCO|nr:conserved hypothetical protein [Ricinus communis]
MMHFSPPAIGHSANNSTISTTRISIRTSSSGYFATTTGKGYDKVYGLAQCRGDVSKANCSRCLHEAAKDIRQACRNQPDSRIWYDYCFLRLSSFNQKVSSVMDKIKSQAAVPKSKGLGKMETKLSPSVTLYTLVHCTGDLTAAKCTKCITKALAHFPKYCTNRKGCKVLYSNCYVR